MHMTKSIFTAQKKTDYLQLLIQIMALSWEASELQSFADIVQ